MVNKELIAKCLSDSRSAQHQLYVSTLPYLSVVCKRYLFNASDLNDSLQETYINIFRYLKSFDANKSEFKTWMNRIAINNCTKINKKNSKIRTQQLVINLHEPRVVSDAIGSLNKREIMAWLKTMPEKYYTVFNLYIIDGFSHEEIASTLNISEASSRKRLSRGRLWLKEQSPSDIEVYLKAN